MPVMPYPMADGSVILGMGFTSAVLVRLRCSLVVESPCSLRRWRRYVHRPMDPGIARRVSEPDPNVRREVLVLCGGFGNAGSELCSYSTRAKDTLAVVAQAPSGAASWPRTRTARSSPSLITDGT